MIIAGDGGLDAGYGIRASGILAALPRPRSSVTAQPPVSRPLSPVPNIQSPVSFIPYPASNPID